MRRGNLFLCYQSAKLNAFLIVENLRDSLNNKFTEICTSGDSLFFDLEVDQSTRTRVKIFDELMWSLRKEIYAIYYAQCIIKDEVAVRSHVMVFRELLARARSNFITL